MTHRFRKQFNTHFTHTIFFVIFLVDQVFRISEPVFVNVYRAQGSILPGWESITMLLRRLTITGSTGFNCVCGSGQEK